METINYFSVENFKSFVTLLADKLKTVFASFSHSHQEVSAEKSGFMTSEQSTRLQILWEHYQNARHYIEVERDGVRKEYDRTPDGDIVMYSGYNQDVGDDVTHTAYCWGNMIYTLSTAPEVDEWAFNKHQIEEVKNQDSCIRSLRDLEATPESNELWKIIKAQ